LIVGFINEFEEPIIELALVLGDEAKNLQAVIDTGFNGFLSVSIEYVNNSDWTFIGYEEYELASGEIVKAKTFLGDIIFDNKQMTTFILISQSKDILVGTRLLREKTLFIDFVDKKVIVNDKK
jgi:clan AA aspartic protease